MTAATGVYQEWQSRIAYYHYLKQKRLNPCSDLGGFTRLFNNYGGKPDTPRGNPFGMGANAAFFDPFTWSRSSPPERAPRARCGPGAGAGTGAGDGAGAGSGAGVMDIYTSLIQKCESQESSQGRSSQESGGYHGDQDDDDDLLFAMSQSPPQESKGDGREGKDGGGSPPYPGYRSSFKK